MPSARNPQLAPLPPPAHGEPFRLGGLQDPVAWYEVEEEKEEVFQSLLTYGCGYTESRTSTVADPSGLRTDQLFYAVHGGPIRRGAQVTLKSLPFIGWVSQAQIYVILSTGTEVQLVHELQNSLDIARRDGDEIARAWYAFRLREAVLSDIPAENRAAAGPITVSPNCHALTCWLARAASGSDHWSEARRDWMDLHASVDTLDMWESLAGCSGERVLISVLFRRRLISIRLFTCDADRAGRYIWRPMVWNHDDQWPRAPQSPRGRLESGLTRGRWYP